MSRCLPMEAQAVRIFRHRDLRQQRLMGIYSMRWAGAESWIRPSWPSKSLGGDNDRVKLRRRDIQTLSNVPAGTDLFQSFASGSIIKLDSDLHARKVVGRLCVAVYRARQTSIAASLLQPCADRLQPSVHLLQHELVLFLAQCIGEQLLRALAMADSLRHVDDRAQYCDALVGIPAQRCKLGIVFSAPTPTFSTSIAACDLSSRAAFPAMAATSALSASTWSGRPASGVINGVDHSTFNPVLPAAHH